MKQTRRERKTSIRRRKKIKHKIATKKKHISAQVEWAAKRNLLRSKRN